MRVLGIDPSTSAAGFVVLEGNGTKQPTLLHEIEVKPSSKLKTKHQKYSYVAGEMIELLNAYRPEKVVIEGYGLNFRNPGSVIPLVELGGLLRYFLIQYEYRYLDPTPGELKKFVFGKGVGPKDQMMMFVLKRWAHESKTNNTADAFALAALGLAHGNQLPGLTNVEREVLSCVKYTGGQ